MTKATNIVCNAAGQPVTVTDANQNTTTLGYQDYDVRTVMDALNRTTTITTDILGHVVGVTDPLGNLSRRVFDTNDRVTTSVDPSNQVTTYQYDNNGNLHIVTLPNTGFVTYKYDVRNRLTTRIDELDELLAKPNTDAWTYDNLYNVLTQETKGPE